MSEREKNLPIAERDFGADAVRITAGLLVLTLHFFLRNGFYHRKMSDVWGILAMTVRSISLACVPLFVMLTGYLKCRKKWTLSYYRSLVPILVSYILISLIHLPYKILYQGKHQSVSEWILQFLDFKLAEYSWYVGMYIGLFLLIPLLNLIWKGCRSKKEHLAVVFTLCSVTFLPSTVNVFIDSEHKLLPAYFTGLYYISYYFLGCYIRTYRPRIRQWMLWTVILLVGAGISIVNMFTRTDPANFYTGFSAGYSHILTALVTLCLFLSLYRLNCSRQWIRRGAAKLSGIIFEIYLISYLPDAIIFASFDRKLSTFMYLPLGFCMVTAVFLCSAVMALAVRWVREKLCGSLFGM